MSEGAGARLGEFGDEEGEESVEENDSGETEAADALENAPEVTQGSNIAPTNKHLVSQSDPSLLNIMGEMATIMGQLSQAAAPRDNSKATAFKNPSMKAPDCVDGTQAHKKKVLYSTSSLTGRAGKWIEPYLSNISHVDPSYLLNNWQLIATQLFTLIGDPNEVRKAEQDLDNLMMK
ncbi:hypothetical protein O181_016436 [Austropuccinia psidii MF-1]|uniref:Uncharacterized protein n=1 Tax=Austropuccinia psidii MF-1 TaxID=1389203 RepID=A0A9Q3C5M4_9BASI|nr:hypothetical protein [Austropuccinia psidii MF-1]